VSDDGDSVQQDFESRNEVKDPPGLVRLWLAAIATASEQEQDWRSEAELIVKRYRQEEAQASAGAVTTLQGSDYFNILYATTETVVPAIYNSAPIPDVRRRFSDKDKAGKTSSQMLERCISYLIDAYDFDGTVEMAVKDSELPGRGVTRVKYDPQIYQDQETGESVVWERALCEHVGWSSFRHGPAKRWDGVEWVAFETFQTRDQLRSLCQQREVAERVPLDVEATGQDKGTDDSQPAPDIFLYARVWEVWDRTSKAVLWVAPGWREGPIRIEPDPLGLKGFFPIPRPLYAIETSDTLVPVPPYRQYRRQAEELDIITQRLMKLTAALRWRGIYDASITEFTKLSNADDGELVPMQNAQALYAQAGGLEKAVYMLPIQELVITIEKLTQQRDLTKQAVWEITGVADIMRGQSDPRETMGAQRIKTQWGSLRVRQRQKAAADYARDLLRLKAEIISNKFSEETILKMSNMELPSMAEKQRAMQIQQMQQQMAMQAQAQQGPQQGPPQRALPPPGSNGQAPMGPAMGNA